MRKLKAIIFDMDGVLFDSERAYMDRLNRFMNQDGKQLSMDMQRKLLGSGDQEKWNVFDIMYEGRLSREQFFKRYDEYYRNEPFSYRSLLFEGVIDTISTLKKQGYRLALASSSTLYEIHSALEECQLTSYFTSILSGEQCVKTKPDPQIYLDTLKALDIQTQDCIVVEDSTYGIRAAKAAGLYVVAKKEDTIKVDQSEADDIISHHHELFSIINKLERSDIQ